VARVLALDVGEARIGVAVSDASGLLASPYTTLHVTRSEEQLWRMLQQLVAETEAELLVIGLPISLDGQLHAQARRVQSFAERLRPHLSVPFTFWDERLSTVEAQRLLIEQRQDEPGMRQRRPQRKRGQQGRPGKRRGKGGHEIDALAAAVILQDYLDQQRKLP
jgi:putative Holliday junction resolvase